MSSARETAERIIEDGHGCAGLAACFRETCACAAAITAAILAERSAIATMLEAKATAMRESLSNNIEAAMRTRTEQSMLEGMEAATTACIAAIRNRE